MPIDERLRTGLVRNTDHLVPEVEQELETTYARARGRQRVRRGAVALAAVAAVAATAWVVDLTGLDDDAAPVVPDPRPRDLVGVRGPLAPGSYSLAALGETKKTGPLPRAIFEVPRGFFSNGGYVIDAGANGTSEWDQYGVVSAYHVDQVLADPCRNRTATHVGQTVSGLARALVRQTGPSTRPRPVVLDGHDGLAMEVFVPPDADLDACTDGEYPLWLAGDGSHWHSDRPGTVHHLWILDVDGTRLVVVASTYPDQPDTQNQELIAIAESIHFEPAAR